MVDVDARRRAALLLRQFRDGTLTNDQLEDGEPRTEDPAVHQAFHRIWFLYDDLREDFFVPRPEAVVVVEACADYLATTDEEYRWPIPNCLLLLLWTPFSLITLGLLNKRVWRRYDFPAHWPFATAELREAARMRPRASP